MSSNACAATRISTAPGSRAACAASPAGTRSTGRTSNECGTPGRRSLGTGSSSTPSTRSTRTWRWWRSACSVPRGERARPAVDPDGAAVGDDELRIGVRRSWMHLAGAGDSRYTMELLPALRESATPKLLVWGEDDGFQKVAYAERFAAEIPGTALVRVPRAGHLPMENAPDQVARALAGCFNTMPL
ncbi:alpha/beta fold hydrolase [Glycomyces lechevalierae]|uniref:alpha/beta fold hydrolase n=1 Tax=Glycomyces lechevalierae TaxID=256034 RepID=UPI0031DB7078